MAGKTGQIIYQARVEDCLDGRSHRYHLACRQSKRKDRQSNIHLHKGAVLLEPGEEVQCHEHTERLDTCPVSQIQNRSAFNSGGLYYCNTERQN